MRKTLSTLKTVVALALFGFVTTALSADTLRLNLGFWPGDLEPELQGRYQKDDLIQGAAFYRYNLDWTDQQTYTIYPLGLQFMRAVGPGKLVLSGNYVRYQPDYKYNGIGSVFLSQVALKNYVTSDWEADAGYQLAVLNNQVLITPKLGYRRHFQEFDYEELTLGDGTFIINGPSPFQSTAGGLYAGLGLQVYVTSEVSLIFDYVQSAGFWTGSMNQERVTAGSVGGAGFISFERAESSYEISIQRYALGVQYDVQKNLHLQVGVREEKLAQSYPDYFGLPIVVSGAGSALNASLTEYLTDLFIWEGTETSTKGFVYFSLSYDLDI